MSIVEFDFNPMAATLADPYPMYRTMRETGRVLQSPMGMLMVHRYDDVRVTHQDFTAFSAGALNNPEAREQMMANSGMADMAPEDAELMFAETMLTTDPPDHERLRRVVNRAFTPRSIAAIEERVRQITRDLLAPLAKGEPFDIVADFAGPLPTVVISELLGIPASDADKFRKWTEAVTGTDVRNRASAEASQQFGRELRTYLSDQVALRTDNPTDDLIGRMVVANEDQIMSHAEVVASCMLLLIAGNETTMRLITNMTLALGRHPDQLERLVDDYDLIATGVEETLRYDSPVQMLFRGAKEDVTFGDTEIPAGKFVLTMLAAANRDPDAFKDPDVFDVGRTDNMHVSFGHGIHYCLGAPLARRETKIAFEELLQMAPRFKVLTSDEDLEYPPAGLLRSPKSLVVQA